jgi:hypothetical protein
MHARIEQLLSIRDGDPVDAAIAEHVGRCTICSDQLRGLSLMRERLQSLPQLDPPDASWQRIHAQLEQSRTAGRSRVLGHVVAAAVVGGIALTLAAGVMMSRHVALPVVASHSAAGSTADDGDEAKRVADLVAQSQHLDYLLQALPERPQIERVSTAATIDTLEERIQWLDVQLSQAPDPQLSEAQASRLWRERVELMDSLVKVRYAEAGRASF